MVDNSLATKIYYYNKLLKKITNAESIRPALNHLLANSFLSLYDARVEEQEVFISPTFLDFYLEKKFKLFRPMVNHMQDAFSFFSAYAFSLNP